MSQKPSPEIKVVFLGETAVGKTSIIRRYNDDSFDEYETSSITMSYIEKYLEIDNKKYKLVIWDTIGQEQYRAISKLFLNDAKIAILVYSIIDRDSLKNLDYWYSLCKEELGNELIFGVAGNKADLYMNQTVSFNEGNEFADNIGAIFAEVSAKKNADSIKFFMLDLVKAYVNKNKEEINKILRRDNKSIKLDRKIKKKKKCCSGKD